MEAIIGGAIAAVIGAGAGLAATLWLTYRNKKSEQTLIVFELLIEVKENLTICLDPAIRELWWSVKYKTLAYDKYKGKIDFLPQDVRDTLAVVAYLVEPVNSSVDVHRLMSALQTHYDSTAFKPIPTFKPLEKSLVFLKNELMKWQEMRK
ncbi:hypothetical protein ACFLXD_00805 [Chloroflexota bacterium]